MLKRILFLIQIWRLLSTCVFDIITTTESDQRNIEFDLSAESSIDHGWGVWTKYSPLYGAPENLELDIQNMHILSEKYDQRIVLSYYITIDRTNQIFYHRLHVLHDQSLQVRELKVLFEIVGVKWVFFYFCYSQTLQTYSTFLYVKDDTTHVSMTSGGPLTQTDSMKEYVLGSTINLLNPFDTSINFGLTAFIGEISDMDLRIGSSNYYNDIPTFLNNLESECTKTFQCSATEEIIRFPDVTFITTTMQTYKLKYVNSRFSISGWVRVGKVEQYGERDDVFFRFSIKKNYKDDQYLGDKALYLKYTQQSISPEDSGMILTTYHEYDPLVPYITQPDDSISLKSFFFSDAITKWHWFSYQEGKSGTNNIELKILWGNDGQYTTQQTYYMSKVHLTDSYLYLSLGGDKFNGFQGEYTNLEYSYCFTQDKTLFHTCHYSCADCFGPQEIHCTACPNAVQTNRVQNQQINTCACKNQFIDVGKQECKNEKDYYNITILEAEEINISNCELGYFQVLNDKNKYCLQCPQSQDVDFATKQKILCIECLGSQLTWYLNPICSQDFEQKSYSVIDGAYFQISRLQKDYDYYLINFNDQFQPEIELCVGCLGQANINDTNYIKRYQFNKETNILCKPCFNIINGECQKISEFCNDCELDKCIECFNGYILNNGSCYKCPRQCPNDCNYDGIQYSCNSCIDGYYFDETIKQCLECGKNCQVCRPIETFKYKLTYLQCLKCIDDKEYFLSADYTNCLKKNIPNCIYQHQEFTSDPTYNQTYKMFFLLSVDIKVNETGYVINNRCGLCEKDYVNVFYETHATPVYKTDSCVHINDIQLSLSPNKLNFEQNTDDHFQIMKYVDLDKGFTTFFAAVGNTLTLLNEKNAILEEFSVIGIIHRTEPSTSYSCSQPFCRICLKNYIWSNEYCILCKNGYYAHLLAGTCYKCPSTLNCETCQHQHSIFKDGWKWDIRGYLQTRGCVAHCYHNYNLFSVSTDYNIYNQYCTSCIQGYELYGQLCIPNCPNSCDTCIVENGKNVCAKCKKSATNTNIQTLVNGQCTNCTQFCSLCLIMKEEQIKYLNPYFSPFNTTFYDYAKYCLKIEDADPKTYVNIYRDSLLGSNTQCDVYQKCYKYLYQVINLYCDEELYNSELGKTSLKEKFTSENLRVSDLFILDENSTSFKVIESYITFFKLNEQSVKMGKYIINFVFKPNEVCVIPRNSFVQSILRQNVFTLINLEIVFQGNQNNFIAIQDNVEIREFSKVTFKNLKFIKYSTTQAYIKLLAMIQVELYIDSLQISDSDEYCFSIRVQNPQIIQINTLSITNSKLQNINGLIDYYFTQTKTSFTFLLDNFQISNSEIKNSIILLQNLTLTNNNQNHVILNVKSNQNIYFNSILFKTNFPITIRKSEIQMDTFLAQFDILMYSSYAVLHGALLVKLKDININQNSIKSQSSLFKLPLFEINNFNFNNNELQSPDNRVITNNIDTLYTDQNEVSNNQILFTEITFSQNNYVGNRAFIEITETSNFQNLVTKFQNIYLNYNQFIKGKNLGKITLENSTIFLQVSSVDIMEFHIIRNLALPELTILNANNAVIQNFGAKLLINLKVIHSIVACIPDIDEIRETTIIFFFNVLNIQLMNIQLSNLTTINQPFILIKSPERSNIRQKEIISFTNCKFTYNTLIINQMSEQLGVIGIISQQEQTITFQNMIFQNNIQHNYVDDLAFISSSTILVINPYSTIFIIQSKFLHNIATNSKNTNLAIVCYHLNLKDSIFSYENILDFKNFSSQMLWGYSSAEEVYLENLNQVFSIQSKGGAGYISGSIIEIINILVEQTKALQGGAFYLIPLSDGQITIENSVFSSCQTNLQTNSHSEGGTFFVDASQASLNLIIEKCNITNSLSRNDGGIMFLEPSRQSNIILLQNLQFSEFYSLITPLLNVPISFSNLNLILLVQFFNVSGVNTYQGFVNYLSLINDITETEITNQNQNYLLSLQQGNLTMLNSTFKNIFSYGFLNFINCVGLTIQNFEIQNFTLLTEQLFKIQLNKKISSNVRFDEIIIHDVKEFSGSVEQSQVQIQLITQPVTKCNKDYKVPPKIKQYYTDQIKFQIINNNLYLCVNKRETPKNIIAIDQISNLHYLYFSVMQINDNYCPNCTSSAFEITNIDDQTQQTIVILTEISFKNNTCGLLGCLTLSSKYTNQIQLSSQTRLLSEDLLEGQLFGVKIQDSNFVSNTATYGGALLISSLNTIINNCQFLNNKVSKNGGAIFYDQSDDSKLYIYNSIISKNQAYVGGGIYLGKYVMNEQQTLNNYIRNNLAGFYGNDIVDNPSQLTVKIGNKLLLTQRIVNNSTDIIDQVVLEPYVIASQNYDKIMVPSGQVVSDYNFFDEFTQQFIPYNFTFRLIPLNNQNEQIKNLDGTLCQIKSRKIINGTEEQYDSHIINKAAVSYNITSQDYNLDQLMVYFDPDLDQFGYLELEFQCNSIKIAQFNETAPYDFVSYFTNYRLKTTLQTFHCKRGEYKKTDGTCQLCDAASDQYNIIAGEQCQIRDQIKMEQVNPARIKLKPYYWRPYESSHSIEFCLNMPENCVGGWDPGNDLCSYAHIGALCEQCDLYNVRGQGKFSVSTIYKCGSCENIGDNTIKVVLISTWTMISIFLSVKGTVETIQKMVSEQKLQKFKIFAKNPKAGYGGVLIKVLTNYLQIIGAVATFQLQLPSLLQGSVKSVSNPVEAMSFSLDCFLISLTEIDIIYFRMIWALIMPVIYTIAFLVIYSIAIILNLTKPNKSAITTTSIYLFTYLQPTLLGGFISLLSFRQISDNLWIQGNVAYRYDTNTHINWLLTFILPSTLMLSLIIPLYMFSSLYRQKHKLEDEETRKNWGYLYNEYSIRAYFWEIIKILEKGFMIVFLTFYEDLIIIKASLIFIITFIYSLLTKKFKPYKLSYLNFIDDISTLVCETSIVLGMTIYSAIQSDNQEIIWPFYIILISINGIFISLIVWEIVLAQLNDQQENIDKIRSKINEKFPNLQHSNWICKQLLTHRGDQQRRIKRRYQMIRQYLINIVKKNAAQVNHQFDKLNHKEDDFLSSVKNSNKCLITDESRVDFMSPNINYKMRVYPEIDKFDETDVIIEKSVIFTKNKRQYKKT